MQNIEYLKDGDLIAVTAPSEGITEPVDLMRFENAKMTLEERGYATKETPDVRRCQKGRSDTAEKRAEEFMDLIRDDRVKAIFSAGGGDFLMEMLPYVDFKQIEKCPKWIQGYSDNTGILYPVTTIADVPTVYAGNVSDFGMAKWHCSLRQNLEMLEGKRREQSGFRRYESEFHQRITGVEDFFLDSDVQYKAVCGAGEDGSVTAKGVLLGGCLDVLINLCGTRFDGTKGFIRRNGANGILWYLETFALSSERLEMALWQLKEAGWFENASGFVFGRPCFFRSDHDVSFDEAVTNALKGLSVPVITGADIGHRPPRLTMINGLQAEVTLREDGEFRLVYAGKDGVQ